MRALVTTTGTLQFISGDTPAAAIAVPSDLVDLASIPDRLVWNGTTIVDAASITAWWVAPNGTRRAYKGGTDWVQLSGSWDSPLVKADDGSWSILTEQQAQRSALHAYAGKRRWREETAGITVNGLIVPTDERTQQVLTAAYARARADDSFSIPNWKTGAGQYIVLSNEQIVTIGEIVMDHMQSCFDLNAEIDELIDSGEIISTTDIDARFASM